jgi:hypothetical protein
VVVDGSEMGVVVGWWRLQRDCYGGDEDCDWTFDICPWFFYVFVCGYGGGVCVVLVMPIGVFLCCLQQGWCCSEELPSS